MSRYSIWIFLFVVTTGNAQSPIAKDTFITKEVEAIMNIMGNQFMTLTGAGNKFPASRTCREENPGTIFAQGLWMSGLLDNSNLAVAVTQYRISGVDYISGPYGHVDSHTQWNKIFSVGGMELQVHIDDFEDNGQIDKEPSLSILTWPGKGNPYFTPLTGLTLPDREMAPYYDVDGDGIYDPWAGDRPIIDVDYPHVVPKKLGFTIFNDSTYHLFSKSPSILGVEVKSIIFTLPQTGDKTLDATIWAIDNITNFGAHDIVNFRAGYWQDMEIGCFENNAYGCAPSKNAWYAYSLDTMFHPCVISYNPDYGGTYPVQSSMFLNKPLLSYMIYSNMSTLGPPEYFIEFNRVLNGRWKDDTPLTHGGNGYQSGGMQTNFIFPDPPSDPNGWSMFTIPKSDILSFHLSNVPTTGKDTLKIGKSFKIFAAHTTHRKMGLHNFNQVDTALANLDNIQNFYNEGFNFVVDPDEYCFQDCLWPGDMDNNGMVNNLDYLIYGLRYGQGGSSSSQYRYNSWSPSIAASWSNQDNFPINSGYADANGDGIIDSQDGDHIYCHWDRKNDNFHYWGGANSQGEELRVKRIYNGLVSPNEVLTHGESFMAEFALHPPVGSAFLGLGFSIRFDTTIIEWHSSLGSDLYQNISKLNGPINHIFKRDNGIDIVFTHKPGSTFSFDSLELFKLRFSIKQTADLNNNFETYIRYQNYLMMQHNGDTVVIGSQGLSIPLQGISTLDHQSIENKKLSVHPNPVNNVLQVSWKELPSGSVFLSAHDMMGRSLGTWPVHDAIGTLSLDVSSWPTGLAYITLRSEHFMTMPVKVVK